jgi:hypothetical protein
MNELAVGLGNQHLDGICLGLKMLEWLRSRDREVRSLAKIIGGTNGNLQVCAVLALTVGGTATCLKLAGNPPTAVADDLLTICHAKDR